MLFRDVIELLAVTVQQNPNTGELEEVETARQVFANKKSIRQSEFYAAALAGLQPQLMFVVRTAEYDDEKKLRYNGADYNIIRTFDKNGEMMELVCSGVVND